MEKRPLIIWTRPCSIPAPGQSGKHSYTNGYITKKDRWLITRRLLDGVPYDALTGEYQLKFEIPLEYDQIRRRCKAAEKQLKTHCK